MGTGYGVAGHPAGETGGSPQRPGHQLARPVLAFDLAAEVAQLFAEESWQHGTRNAKTLVKEPDFRVVLVGLKHGTRIDRHRAPGRISIHTVAGRLRIDAGGTIIDLPLGHVLTLDADIPHDVESAEDVDSAFLLTIAWPLGRVAESND